MQLEPNDHKLIATEEQYLAQIQARIRSAFSRRSKSHVDINRQMEMLREEAAKAKPADLPAIFDQMNTQRALMDRSSTETAPEPLSPYFARLTLAENGREKTILLGHQTFLDDPKLPVIDWRHAPISRIFFNYREGEDYEEQLPGRLAVGTVLARHILTIEKGELVQITGSQRAFVKTSDGWQARKSAIVALSGGAGTATRGSKIGTGAAGGPSPDIAALLDQDQYRVLNSDIDEPLLILGGAGCGKTTVALHRMAYLNYKDPRRFAQQKMIVIVPEQGLVRLSKRLLDSIGLPKVSISTFDNWIAAEARRIIRGLPKRVYPDTPGNIIKFKRHPAMRQAFKSLIAVQADQLANRLADKLPGSKAACQLLVQRGDLAILERMELVEKNYIASFGKKLGAEARSQRVKVVKELFSKEKRRLMQVANDRTDLFTSSELMSFACSESNGELSQKMVEQLVSYSIEQHGQTTSQQYASIDTEKLNTIDGRSLQDQEAGELAGTIDSEDFAILLELYFLKRGKASDRAAIKTYSHIVIDEAQDLAPLERNVLGRALGSDAAVTIAGDAAQQIDPSASFSGWAQVLDELGVSRVTPNKLTTTYRSSTQIADFAHHILGPLAPATRPKSIKEGLPVSFSSFRSDGERAIVLNESLTDLMINEPHASIAIIASDFEAARRVYDVLRDLPKIRLVQSGDFEFRPGIEVTDASQVKGLEFDYVIIPDVSFAIYHDTPEHRRLLHVAATRAIHQLWVTYLKEPSSLIASFIKEQETKETTRETADD